MNAKIKRIINSSKICKESKYEYHPNKIKLKEAPIPQFSDQILHIGIFISAIDKFSKYAKARLIAPKATVYVKEPFRKIR